MRAHLINSVMPFQPYLMFENGSIAKQSGFCYDILVSMAQALNFTYTTVMPEDRGWGYRASNSTEFNGIIGMLQRYIFLRHGYFFAYFFLKLHLKF